MKRLTTGLALVTAVACGGPRQNRILLQNKGSDTLVNVAQGWAEAYKTVAPSVAVAVSGGGSGTGISAMINGTVDIANSSREMKESELEAARANGIEPVEHVVGYDALAVFIHPDNPVEFFTIAQLAGIYGEGGEIERWGDLGVAIPGCDSGEIVRVSRQNNSGTYAYFREAVLGKDGEYKLGSRDLHGSKDVVDLVENTPCAIGYSGLAYATEHVKMPCIVAATEGAPDDAEGESAEPPCIVPTVDSAIDRSYPIARPLFMYSAGEPQGEVKKYLDWILSEAGQCIILDKGYAPVRELSCPAS
jgi:phosphate transport system substrate-binding protein